MKPQSKRVCPLCHVMRAPDLTVAYDCPVKLPDGFFDMTSAELMAYEKELLAEFAAKFRPNTLAFQHYKNWKKPVYVEHLGDVRAYKRLTAMNIWYGPRRKRAPAATFVAFVNPTDKFNRKRGRIVCLMKALAWANED